MKRAIGAALKARAKSRGLTQAEVARLAEVSLPTVKRWFLGEGLDLERLATLLEILDVSLAELAAYADLDQNREFEFSSEQERAMAEDPALFGFLDQLLKGRTPKQVGREYRLDEPRIATILRALERLKLIERHPGGKAKLLVQGQPRWSLQGPLSKSLKRRAIEAFLAQSGLDGVRLGMHEVNPDDQKKLEVMLAEIQSFARGAESRAKARPDQPVAIGLLIGHGPFRWDLLNPKQTPSGRRHD